MNIKIAVCALLACLFGDAGVRAATSPGVRIDAGQLQGLHKATVDAFLGIPYAAPPVGANRWRPPQPVVPWQGTRAADRFSPSCWQTLPQGFGPFTHEFVVQSDVGEDCLYLNVWRPAGVHARLPVMVWIHGGGFGSGSASLPIYNGSALATKGIIVVGINYRLGAFGFLALPELTAQARRAGTPPGNFGLQDMLAALRWVKRNIAAFGGDPDEVTICGQSAGAMAVNDLMVSPMAKGLFQRAISQSGLPGTRPPLTFAEAERRGAEFVKSLGAPSLAALRALPADQFTSGFVGDGPRFTAIVDGMLLPGKTEELLAEGQYMKVPMLVGLAADDASAVPAYVKPDTATYTAILHKKFAPVGDRFAGFYASTTDRERAGSIASILRDQGVASLYDFAELRLHTGNSSTFAYIFSHVMPGPQSRRYGAFHTSEVPYIFGTLDAAPERGFTAEDRAVSVQISAYWANFIKTGNPNGQGLPDWPQIAGDDPKIQDIGDDTHARPPFPPDKLRAVQDYLAKGGKPTFF